MSSVYFVNMGTQLCARVWPDMPKYSSMYLCACLRVCVCVRACESVLVYNYTNVNIVHVHTNARVWLNNNGKVKDAIQCVLNHKCVCSLKVPTTKQTQTNKQAMQPNTRYW